VFSHIMVGVRDVDRAMAFDRPLMQSLGNEVHFVAPERPWAGWQSSPEPRPLFLSGRPYDQQAHQSGNGQMVASLAHSREQVRRAHAVALARGGRCEGAPGLRPEYHPTAYGACFRDPDGNKLCVACHHAESANRALRS